MTIISARMATVMACLLGCGIAAYAAAPGDTIAARQANFKQMGKGMKAVSEQVKSPNPDIAAIRAGAAAIDQAAGKVAGYFPQGSGPQAGVKTSALPAIWEKNIEFKADAARLVKAAAALRAAADSGNIDAAKVQFAVVAGACKECHQNFRARDD